MAIFSDVLQRAFEETPDRLAVVLQFAGLPDKSLTIRDLLEGANGYARQYEREGIKPSEVVILILQHGEELVFAFWGAILHGAIPSIMPFLTEKLSPERYRADLASLISITRPSAILTYPEFEVEVKAAIQKGDSVRSVMTTADVELPSTPDFESLQGGQRLPTDIVLLQHSSGTTGLQKGVALTHQAVFNQLDAYARAILLDPEKDIICSWLPLYHDMGLIASFILPVLTRVPLVIMSPFDWIRAPYRLMQSVSKYKGTLTWLPNFAFNFCTQKIRERNLEGVDLSSWRAVINCSEPVRPESHGMFYEKFAPYGLQKKAMQTSYAMAENVFGVTQSSMVSEPQSVQLDREAFMVERVARPVADGKPGLQMMSSGCPITNTKLRIVNRDFENLSEGMIGEVAVQSDCMLSGYYNRPEETKKAMVEGWYLTGDFGFLLGGELYVSGRKKDMIIVGGKNVYPQDLESLACEVESVHAGRVVAFGVFNEEVGTEDVVIVAEIESNDADIQQQISEAIRQYVTKNSTIALRHVKVVGPKWIIKTSSGKVARFANKEKYIRLLADVGNSE
jgi:fatty-acyl-CoA synthase